MRRLSRRDFDAKGSFQSTSLTIHFNTKEYTKVGCILLVELV